MQKKSLCLAAVALLLGGCAIPGSHLSLANKHVVPPPEAQAGGTPFDLDRLFDVHLLTPGVIEQLQGERTARDDAPGRAGGAARYEYRVGPGDILNVVVWDHPELGSPMITNPTLPSQVLSGQSTATGNETARTGTWVDAQGSIFFPYAGRLQVAGRTLPEIRSALARRLAKYIRNPQVDVTVMAFRSQRVNVSGAVEKPAQLALTTVPLTLMDAISQAGGFSKNADTTHVRWTHRGVDHVVSVYDYMNRGDARKNPVLGPDDVVFVPNGDQMKVYVMGEVKKQNALRMSEGGMSLTDALAQAEGMNQEMADASGVFVIRARAHANAGQKVADIYQLNLRDASAFALGNQFKLEPSDIVYVTVAPMAKWNRVINQILPSLTSVGWVATIYSSVK